MATTRRSYAPSGPAYRGKRFKCSRIRPYGCLLLGEIHLLLRTHTQEMDRAESAGNYNARDLHAAAEAELLAELEERGELDRWLDQNP